MICILMLFDCVLWLVLVFCLLVALLWVACIGCFGNCGLLFSCVLYCCFVCLNWNVGCWFWLGLMLFIGLVYCFVICFNFRVVYLLWDCFVACFVVYGVVWIVFVLFRICIIVLLVVCWTSFVDLLGFWVNCCCCLFVCGLIIC